MTTAAAYAKLYIVKDDQGRECVSLDNYELGCVPPPRQVQVIDLAEITRVSDDFDGPMLLAGIMTIATASGSRVSMQHGLEKLLTHLWRTAKA
jgi:hypothetical protein